MMADPLPPPPPSTSSPSTTLTPRSSITSRSGSPPMHTKSSSMNPTVAAMHLQRARSATGAPPPPPSHTTSPHVSVVLPAPLPRRVQNMSGSGMRTGSLGWRMRLPQPPQPPTDLTDPALESVTLKVVAKKGGGGLLEKWASQRRRTSQPNVLVANVEQGGGEAGGVKISGGEEHVVKYVYDPRKPIARAAPLLNGLSGTEAVSMQQQQQQQQQQPTSSTSPPLKAVGKSDPTALSDVFLAVNPTDPTDRVILKRFPLEANERQQHLDGLYGYDRMHEATCLSLLGDFRGETKDVEGRRMLAMKYYEGASPRDLVDSGVVRSRADLEKVSFLVLREVRRIHAKGVIHGDIRWENIRLDVKESRVAPTLPPTHSALPSSVAVDSTGIGLSSIATLSIGGASTSTPSGSSTPSIFRFTAWIKQQFAPPWRRHGFHAGRMDPSLERYATSPVPPPVAMRRVIPPSDPTQPARLEPSATPRTTGATTPVIPSPMSLPNANTANPGLLSSGLEVHSPHLLDYTLSRPITTLTKAEIATWQARDRERAWEAVWSQRHRLPGGREEGVGVGALGLRRWRSAGERGEKDVGGGGSGGPGAIGAGMQDTERLSLAAVGAKKEKKGWRISLKRP